MNACERCLARAWLLAHLSGHLDHVRNRLDQVLGLESDDLIAAVGGRRRRELQRQLARFDPESARRRAHATGLDVICRCDPAYPRRLTALAAPPAVLHVRGGLERFHALGTGDPVAVVGARQASAYGIEVARALGGGLASAGVTVLSGMALGIDSAAHAGALTVQGPTIAVLPGPADRPYPPGKRALYRHILACGAAVSELPPGVGVRRWMFPARNRLIAGLAAVTVVVEAGVRSGALLTATVARELDRPVGAVPGRVTSRLAVGPNELLARGAHLVRGPQDVLDLLFGAGVRIADADSRPPLESHERSLLRAIADGRDTPGALTRAGFAPEQCLAVIASLELGGYVRREPGGRLAVVP